MSWSDSYVVITCPNCNGAAYLPDVSGNGSYHECGTCRGLRMVRVPEGSLAIYDPDVEDTSD